MSDKHQLHIDLEMDAISPLPEITRICLFESARELLLNAVKHSITHHQDYLSSAEGLLQLVYPTRELASSRGNFFSGSQRRKCPDFLQRSV